MMTDQIADLFQSLLSRIYPDAVSFGMNSGSWKYLLLPALALGLGVLLVTLLSRLFGQKARRFVFVIGNLALIVFLMMTVLNEGRLKDINDRIERTATEIQNNNR